MILRPYGFMLKDNTKKDAHASFFCSTVFHICEKNIIILFFQKGCFVALQIFDKMLMYITDIVWRAKDESNFQRPVERPH